MLHTLVFIPFGEASGQVPASFIDAFPAGFAARPNLVQVPAPVHLRLGAHEQLLVADAAGQRLLCFDAAGQFLQQYALPGQGDLLDFAAYGDGWLLLREGQGGALLTYVQADGVAAWQTLVPEESLEDARQVIVDGTQVFLAGHRDGSPLRRIDPQTGALGEAYSRGNSAGQLYPAAEKTWASMAWWPASSQRGIAYLRPGAATPEGMPFAPAWQNSLRCLFGADAASRLYLYRIPALAGAEGLLRLTPRGEVAGELALRGIVVGSDGESLAYFSVSDDVFSRHDRTADGSIQVAEYPLTAEQRAALGNQPWAAVLQDDGALRLDLAGNLGYGSSLTFQGASVQASALEAGVRAGRMQLAASWQVTRQGAVIIPVTTPEGIALVRVEF